MFCNDLCIKPFLINTSIANSSISVSAVNTLYKKTGQVKNISGQVNFLSSPALMNGFREHCHKIDGSPL